MARPRTIVAGGGGSFRTHPGNALDTFLLARTGSRTPRVAYLPTAGGDAEPAIEAFVRSFTERRAVPTVIRLFQRSIVDLDATLLEQDLVIVNGGNTANMMAIWGVHGVTAALRRAYDAGVVMSGWSAGGLCWFESGVTDSFHPTDLVALDGLLGWLGGSFCPHYDSEESRKPLYRKFVADGALADGYAADDGVGLVFENERFVEAVSFLPGKSAYRVARDGAHAKEIAIPARLLEDA